ncbi:hypothetical protein KIH07_12190 [Hydrogenophaga taeniospiralis]|uniref:hypothetical protein n=1 Tax=Hydrogenophaga taeniospiralis TaxID=65656 RepID=UPI0008D4B1D1|nr:hypothetical protein [Hydrogenophaga taeniospiralis]OGB18563.1 MAG: hypothetical protein A3I64_12950 [Burkholderiales bacterium RIFCSPLOWO2_02_FULL_67_64]OGB39215.1 MAG: hypothetical protein A3E51_19875 [Burkholderiales bacterium RIFCSPHIGHO2_12_FULL_67_38]OGB41720.1 MAG: hypothetical protein A2W72_06780 [Burkholderiales bacterium RIFCSPLOWO2_12_67_14]OGB78615.1 MAG: hypothetical protein A3G82_13855 [Burkholderiales bacterium RIFCSPLOWO2_12_FULL_67_210]MCB4364497.1 hypothetical protein [Hyd
MTVIVAGKLIQKSESLSELARQTLTYIDGGPQWLAWALPNPMVCYEVADETTLLAEVQQGLHASPMALLPGLGLWVSPVKLMSLGSANLRTLGQAETGDTSAAVVQQTQRIMADYNLVDAQQLRSASEFLQDLGVAAAPVFQALDFNDRVALHALAAVALGQDGDNPAALRQEAAAFAVQQARTVPEFCDYYQVYLAHSKKMNALGGTAATRGQLCSQAVQTLLPLAFGAMDCPQLPDRLPSPDEVEQCLRNWLARGHKLGFSRLSQAVLQMVTQTIFTTETGAEARRLFDLYLSTAQAFLSGNRLKESRLGQDGASLTFTLQNATQQAVLHVSADRLLSLRKFGSWVAPDAASGLPSSPPTSTPE